jgi:fibronectin-binding autotransporter adhesin
MGQAAAPILEVAAVVVAVVQPELAPAIGEYILGAETAASVGAATTAAVGAAAYGAGSGALSEAIQGGDTKDILKAAAIGGAAGAVGSEVSSAVKPELVDLGASKELANIGASTLSGAARGFTGAELSGQNLQQAGRAAGIGGAEGLITSGISEAAQAEGASPSTAKGLGSLAGVLAQPTVSTLFGAGPSSTSAPITGQPSVTAGTTPSTQALAQALNVGGGDINPPVQLGGEGSKRNVWNQASLRTMEPTGDSNA